MSDLIYEASYNLANYKGLNSYVSFTSPYEDIIRENDKKMKLFFDYIKDRQIRKSLKQ